MIKLHHECEGVKVREVASTQETTEEHMMGKQMNERPRKVYNRVYLKKCSFKNFRARGAWVAQWVRASAFGSGHGPRVLGSSPASGSLLSGEPASSSLSACLSACL